jgi:tetratricopeptide (TPR) repeat protein
MSTPTVGRAARRVAEGIAVGIACLAPWAFGSVDAWAEFGLYVGTAAIAGLVAVADGTSSRSRRLLCWPGLGLAGLALLALFQAVPLPGGLFPWISPASATLRADLLPRAPELVVGDPGPVVPLPWLRLSQDPGESLRMAARLAGGWLLFQGVLGLGSGMAGARRLAVALSINAALLSAFSIVQTLTWNGRIFWVRPVRFGDAWSVGGPFDHHTHLAECLNMGLGMALGLAIPGGWRAFLRGGTNRPWAAFAGLAIAAGIIASNSRGGFLAMLGAGGVVALASRARAIGLGLGLAIGGVAVLALVVLMLMTQGNASPLGGRLASILDPGNDAYSVRMMLARAALQAWWAYPTWGTGLGTFPSGTSPYLEGSQGSSFARAENEYLDLLSEAGLVGAALMLLGLLGVVRLARRALAGLAGPRDRGLVLGATFGLTALAINSLSDFGPHVAGVGVPAIILVATLCRAGLDAESRGESGGVPPRRVARLGWTLCGLATVGIGIGLAYRGWADARAESLLAVEGLPRPGGPPASMDDLTRTLTELERRREALEAALALDPGWADGHLRLGVIDLIVYYKRKAGDPNRPANLLGVFEAARDGARRLDGSTRRHLVPAARSFLEARRACPVSPLAHAGLASLAGLLEGGDPAAAYLGRASRLAGNRREVLTLAGGLAAGVGDLELAALCWRRALEAGPDDWAGIADAASAALTPDQILDEVIPNGRLALQFADRLYPKADAGGGSKPARRKFLREAARRLPDDRDVGPAERLQLEAHAWAGLDEPGPAREKMEEALALEPGNFAWRKELIGWLLRWGRVDEAHEQAKVGFYYASDSKATREALEVTADAMARRASSR